MLKVTVIGFGNVAQHVIHEILNHNQLELVEVYNKSSKSNTIPGVKVINNLKNLKEADIYIIAISDDAIHEVSNNLPFRDRLVVHTSGTQPITILSDKNRRGVWYPLQTFSKDKSIDFSEVPICIEASSDEDYSVLEEWSTLFSKKVYKMSSEQRKALHVAAVFSSNFVNQMYHIGTRICEEKNIPFEVLKPLIKETAEKVQQLDPFQAQTGPAVRSDMSTINSHKEYLENSLDLQEIYKVLTESIQKTHVQKL